MRTTFLRLAAVARRSGVDGDTLTRNARHEPSEKVAAFLLDSIASRGSTPTRPETTATATVGRRRAPSGDEPSPAPAAPSPLLELALLIEQIRADPAREALHRAAVERHAATRFTIAAAPSELFADNDDDDDDDDDSEPGADLSPSKGRLSLAADDAKVDSTAADRRARRAPSSSGGSTERRARRRSPYDADAAKHESGSPERRGRRPSATASETAEPLPAAGDETNHFEVALEVALFAGGALPADSWASASPTAAGLANGAAAPPRRRRSSPGSQGGTLARTLPPLLPPVAGLPSTRPLAQPSADPAADLPPHQPALPHLSPRDAPLSPPAAFPRRRNSA